MGETSTRSRPRSRAIFNASNGTMMPSCSPLSSITRTSRARILSLIRINCLAERLSNCAMVFLQSLWQRHVPTQYNKRAHYFEMLLAGKKNQGKIDEILDSAPSRTLIFYRVRIKTGFA